MCDLFKENETPQLVNENKMRMTEVGAVNGQ